MYSGSAAPDAQDAERHRRTGSPTPNPRQVARVYTHALQQLPVLKACLSRESFARAVARSVDKRFHGTEPDTRAVAQYVESLHAADLGLAVACAAGHDPPWEHFVTTYRPVLYRAARALSGDEATARDLADTLWAELYGVGSTRASLEAGAERRSLLEYFHGRSQLATWLRSVLSQRHVDLIRSSWRLEPLESEDGGESDRPPNTGRRPFTQTETVDPDRGEYITLFQQVLGAVVGALAPRDRLRLCCYYTQELTLAATGRVLGEHEATVSRRLASARKGIRTEVERMLIDDHGLSQSEVKLCYRYVTEESSVDLSRLLASQGS